MSLYYEAASFIDGSGAAVDGSVRSRVYAHKSLKSNPGSVYALLSEATRWSQVISPILDQAGVLKIEKKLSPSLALLLTHDLLLAKRGIAAPRDHVLNQAINRHKARLNAEFTRARVKSGHTTIETWKRSLEGSRDPSRDGNDQPLYFRPRWARINTLSSSLARETAPGGCLAGWSQVGQLPELEGASKRLYFVDHNVQNLIAIPPGTDLTKTQAYKEGRIILQDKASCFPATLLDPESFSGDVIDGCSAPGNKATHLAALCNTLAHSKGKRKVFAVERDQNRSKILRKMVKVAVGTDSNAIECLGDQDFSALDSLSSRWNRVEAILLDPSCSGSGIIGRDEGNAGLEGLLRLPQTNGVVDDTNGHGRSRKRKRNDRPSKALSPPAIATDVAAEEEEQEQEGGSQDELHKRLEALSNFQLSLLKHALRFPSARRLVYSTCSVHAEENEFVVIRLLQSKLAKDGGWRLLKREEQVEGMRSWHIRGDRAKVAQRLSEEAQGLAEAAETISEACIRCHKAGADGTMGFFAVGFVRDDAQSMASVDEDEDEEEFRGFSSSESDTEA